MPPALNQYCINTRPMGSYMYRINPRAISSDLAKIGPNAVRESEICQLLITLSVSKIDPSQSYRWSKVRAYV